MSQRPPPIRERPRTVGEALEAAVLALGARRADEAERLAAYVLRSDRSNARAAQVLGQALIAQDRAAEAIAPLERAARRGGDPETVALLARALARSARADDAIAALEDGLRRAPDALALKLELAHLCLDRGDRVRARQAYAEVRAAAPQRLDALVGLARALSGDGEFAAAADLYREALDRWPDEAPLRISLARCLLEAGDREGAEAALRAATRGGRQQVWDALNALAGAPHGRTFLRPSQAAAFLRGDPKR